VAKLHNSTKSMCQMYRYNHTDVICGRRCGRYAILAVNIGTGALGRLGTKCRCKFFSMHSFPHMPGDRPNVHADSVAPKTKDMPMRY